MATTQQKEMAALIAEQVDVMVKALCEKGFTSEDSIRMVCSMLASAHVYVPFVDAVVPSQTKH